MTSSCVAVEDWTTTLWGGEVGTRTGQRANSSSLKKSKVSRSTHALEPERKTYPPRRQTLPAVRCWDPPPQRCTR